MSKKYVCEKCGEKFRTRTEWKNHEFECRNYFMLQWQELERVDKYFGDRATTFQQNVITDSFKDEDNKEHKLIKFELYIVVDGTEMTVTDANIGVGELCDSEDIIEYIENKIARMENGIDEDEYNVDALAEAYGKVEYIDPVTSLTKKCDNYRKENANLKCQVINLSEGIEEIRKSADKTMGEVWAQISRLND